jgi:hypothetical protein
MSDGVSAATIGKEIPHAKRQRRAFGIEEVLQPYILPAGGTLISKDYPP